MDAALHTTPERHLGDRRLLVWLALIPVLCALTPRDLWAPDEPRYGQVAREMVASGEWLVPHVNGAPYAEKPPVYWWGVAALSWPGGRVTAITARLGGALYAFGCALLLAFLVRRWFRDRALAVTAVALFSSMVFVLWVSHRAALDFPLVFFVLLAIERGEAWLASERLLPALGCGAAWAAAILVKGPLGFLFPPAALAAGAAVRRGVPSWRNPGWILVPAVMAGLCLAWLLPALASGGDAYADRLLGQIRGRATGAEGHHLRPVYYFLERWPVVTMPWSLHLVAGVLAMLGFRRAPKADRGGLATCAAIGVGGFVLLSVIATKREVYLVALLPFVCAAAAYALHRGSFPRIERVGRVLMTGTPVVLALGLLAFPLIDVDGLRARRFGLAPSVDARLYLSIAPAAFVLVFGAVHAWRAGAETTVAIRRTALYLSSGLAIAFVAFAPHLDRYKSFAPAARAAEQAARGGPVFNVGFGQPANLLWSLDRDTTPELHGAADIRDRLPPRGPVGALVADRKWLERQRASDPTALAWLREVWRAPVDKRGLVVLTNAPDDGGG